MTAILNLTTGIVFLKSWSGTISGGSLTLSGPLLLADGLVGTPSLAWSTNSNTGFYQAATNEIDIAIAGVRRFIITSTRFINLNDTASYEFGAGTDLVLTRDAPNTLALRNGASAQTFNLYNTFTNATTYNRFSLDLTTANSFRIGYSLNNSATTFPLTLTSVGGATFLSSVTSGGDFQVANGGAFYWGTQTQLRSPADAQLTIRNGGNTAGIGVDVSTDSIIAIRNRAQNADGAVKAAFHNTSTNSVLTVSSNTIAPTGTVHHVGAGLIKTITTPTLVASPTTIFLVPDSAFTYDATGNIVVPSGGGTAVVNKVMSFTWDGTKWNPSY